MTRKRGRAGWAGRAALLAGLAANLVVPLLFILGVSQALRLWHQSGLPEAA